MKMLPSDDLLREDRENEKHKDRATEKLVKRIKEQYAAAAKQAAQLMRPLLKRLKSYDKPPAALNMTKETAKVWREARQREAIRTDEESIQQTASRMAGVGVAVAPLVDALLRDVWQHNAHTGAEYIPERWTRDFYRDWAKPSSFFDMLRNGFNLLIGGIHSLREWGKRLSEILSRIASRAINVLRGAANRIMNWARMQWIRMENALRRAEIGKQWFTQQDPAVRESHDAMHRQIRRWDEPFLTGAGNYLMYPGDTSAPIEEWINCRCILRRVRIV